MSLLIELLKEGDWGSAKLMLSTNPDSIKTALVKSHAATESEKTKTGQEHEKEHQSLDDNAMEEMLEAVAE